MSGLTAPPMAAVAEFDAIIHQQALGYKAVLAENTQLFQKPTVTSVCFSGPPPGLRGLPGTSCILECADL